MSKQAPISQTTLVNGLDTEAMGATVAAIRDQPVIARFQFRAANQWLGGGQTRTTITDFDGACEQHLHAPAHVIDSDEPHVMLGSDRAANPAQHALHALAACLCSTLVIHATARGIELRSVESVIEGDVDVRGALGLDESVRRGYSEVRIGLRVDADAAPEVIDELIQIAQDCSPVADIFRNPTPLAIRKVASL